LPFLDLLVEVKHKPGIDSNVIGVVGWLAGGNDGRSVVDGSLNVEVPATGSKSGKVITRLVLEGTRGYYY
jgi:hypothetical protein